MLSFSARDDYTFPAVTFSTLHEQTMTRRPINAKSRHILQEVYKSEKSDFTYKGHLFNGSRLSIISKSLPWLNQVVSRLSCSPVYVEDKRNPLVVRSPNYPGISSLRHIWTLSELASVELHRHEDGCCSRKLPCKSIGFCFVVTKRLSLYLPYARPMLMGCYTTLRMCPYVGVDGSMWWTTLL
jgi:hypothetical protein